MNLRIGRRDHHHIVYHKDHGEVFGEGEVPLSVAQVIDNSLGWCRNTGINAFNLHVTGPTRDILGIAPYERAKPPFLHMGYWSIYETIRHHRERGVDLVGEIGRALREAGVAFWIGLRINDIHHVTGGESAHPIFWVDHPECRTNESVPWDPMRSVGALDFAHQAVRDDTKGLIARTLELYDVDGISLDFNRFPILFKSQEVDRHRDRFTAWMKEVREVVDRASRDRGHPITLEARVPSVAERCRQIGADVLKWIDQEIVNILTASTVRMAEFEMPMEPFLEAAKNRDVLVFAGIEGLQPDGMLCREMYRAWAYHYWTMGVDGLHLFNNCYNHLNGGGPHPVEELHDPVWLARLGKRYVVTRTMAGPTRSEGTDPALSYPKQLPRELSSSDDGRGETIAIQIDDDLEAARGNGTLDAVTLRLRVMELTSYDAIGVKVNGRPVPDDLIRIRGGGSRWGRRQVNLPYTYAQPPWSESDSGQHQWILCDLTLPFHLQPGRNEVEVILTRKEPDVLAPRVLYNVEVDVKYRDLSHESNLDLGRF